MLFRCFSEEDDARSEIYVYIYIYIYFFLYIYIYIYRVPYFRKLLQGSRRGPSSGHRPEPHYDWAGAFLSGGHWVFRPQLLGRSSLKHV